MKPRIYNYQCKAGHKHQTQRRAKTCHHCRFRKSWEDAKYPRFQTTRYKVPENIHPWVRFLLIEAKEQRCTLKSLADRSGVMVGTIRNWRDRAMPNLANFEACLNSLGYEIQFIPIRELNEHSLQQ